MSKKDLQRHIHHDKDETGEIEVDMKKVAKFSDLMGWEMPVPKDPLDILAQELSRAARDEIKHDDSPGRPYRVSHAIPIKQGQQSLFAWIDIDEASRNMMLKSLNPRRAQMVGDGLQLNYDADHWNARYGDEEEIQLNLDLSFDVELRKHAAAAI